MSTTTEQRGTACPSGWHDLTIGCRCGVAWTDGQEMIFNAEEQRILDALGIEDEHAGVYAEQLVELVSASRRYGRQLQMASQDDQSALLADAVRALEEYIEPLPRHEGRCEMRGGGCLLETEQRRSRDERAREVVARIKGDQPC